MTQLIYSCVSSLVKRQSDLLVISMLFFKLFKLEMSMSLEECWSSLVGRVKKGDESKSPHRREASVAAVEL